MPMTSRDRLVNAAQEELVLGLGRFEMQGVAKRAQVSVGLAYHHFGSKGGLVAAVVKDFYSQLDAAAFDGFSASHLTWAERESARISAYVQFHYRHPLAALMVGALSRSQEAQDVEELFTNKQLVNGARMIAAAQDQGILSKTIDPDLTIALMVGGIRQALHGALRKEFRPDAHELANRIWLFMASALGLSVNPSIPPAPSQSES